MKLAVEGGVIKYAADVEASVLDCTGSPRAQSPSLVTRRGTPISAGAPARSPSQRLRGKDLECQFPGRHLAVWGCAGRRL